MKSFEEHGVDAKRKENGPDGHGWRRYPHRRAGSTRRRRRNRGIQPSTGKSWDRVAEEVALVAEKTGCKISRHDANDLDDLRAQLADADLLANATPIGMGKLEGQSPIPDASFLHPGLVIQDAIYQPKPHC